jgi:nicotinamide-nucleotide amidase
MQRAVIDACRARGRTVATAESLTAGLVSAMLADVPGASAVLRGGVVAYATDLKHVILGVDPVLLEHVVSEPVAAAMAQGACRVAGADLGLATTGVAGPDWLDDQPPGTVWVAVHDATTGAGRTRRLLLAGDRGQVRAEAAQAVLGLLLELLADNDLPDHRARE